MKVLYLKAILAGLFFGIWPFFMNKSGLSGNVSSACFAALAFIGVLPFAIHSCGWSIPTANWKMVILAGLFGAIGLLFFNGMLADASPQEIGNLFIVVVVAQIGVATLYQIFVNGYLSIEKMVGYVAAIVAVYLLQK